MTKEQNKQKTAGPPSTREKKKEAAITILEIGTDEPKIIRKKKVTDNMGNVEFKAMGGRIGYKAGSTGCKLAMKGKGRAYGKNS